MSHEINSKIVVLGTGGTIAGLSSDAENPAIYKSGQLGVADLMKQAGFLQTQIECEDIARIDSKNIGLSVWQTLYKAIFAAQSRHDVSAVVVTHGTDTLEETTFLLEAMGPWPKPVIMTCAMKPADHPQADGPVNLHDALLLARTSGLQGVYLVFNGQAHYAFHAQKISTDEFHAFSSGPAGLAAAKNGAVWHLGQANIEFQTFNKPSTDYFLKQTQWPRVEWLTHHAAIGRDGIDALLNPSKTASQPVRGLVVAGTGAGTFKPDWEEALLGAASLGVEVWISSRCTWGRASQQAQQKIGVLTQLPPAKACMALALSVMHQDEKKSALQS
jgi:L-asparaginase